MWFETGARWVVFTAPTHLAFLRCTGNKQTVGDTLPIDILTLLQYKREEPADTANKEMQLGGGGGWVSSPPPTVAPPPHSCVPSFFFFVG